MKTIKPSTARARAKRVGGVKSVKNDMPLE